jgi:hypothetical protein
VTGPGKLPARDFEEIRLAEALERGRCPVCDARQEASYAALRGLAREGATDRGLRAQMDKGLGFCQPTASACRRWSLLQTSSQLATAVLLDAVLRRRLATLKKLSGDDASGQLAGSGGAVGCEMPRLRPDRGGLRAAVRRLLELSADGGLVSGPGVRRDLPGRLYALWLAAAAVPGTCTPAGRRFWPLSSSASSSPEDARRVRPQQHLGPPPPDHAEQQAAGAASIRLFGGTPDRDRTPLTVETGTGGDLRRPGDSEWPRSVQFWQPSPGVPCLEVSLPALPYPVARLIDAALVGELTVIGPDERPITYPMVPLLWGDRIFLTSSVLDSAKIAHIKANPRVSFSITNPDGLGTFTGMVTVQCDARVADDDLHAGWERLLPTGPARTRDRGAAQGQARLPAHLRAGADRTHAAADLALAGRPNGPGASDTVAAEVAR